MIISGEPPLTADVIWHIPDDGNRYEVIDGDICIQAPPNTWHQYTSTKLAFHLANHVFPRDLGIVLAVTGVVLDEFTGVQPDLLFLAKERLHLFSKRGIEGATDLMVEILSPTSMLLDRRVKMARYARAGIPDYWIVDTDERTLEAYQL